MDRRGESPLLAESMKWFECVDVGELRCWVSACSALSGSKRVSHGCWVRAWSGLSASKWVSRRCFCCFGEGEECTGYVEAGETPLLGECVECFD